MGVENLSATLQVWRYVGGPPRTEEFLNRLVIEPTDNIEKVKAHNHRADLMSIELSEFSKAEEPTEAFVYELDIRLKHVARWLERQPKTLFSDLRHSGFRTHVLFTGWIDGDQLDLRLPPELLRICGELGLGIEIITND